jgi:hypothetical protein
MRRHPRFASQTERAAGKATPPRPSRVGATGRVKTPATAEVTSSTAPLRSGIWYVASLDGRQVAAGHLATLCEQFAVTVRAAGEPAGACLFAVSADDGAEGRRAADSQAAADVFFSPSAISVVPKILAAMNAQPSAAPDRVRALLLVGRPLDWDLLPCATH